MMKMLMLFAGLVVFLCPVRCEIRRDEQTEGGKFNRTHAGLTRVPTDIPEGVQDVDLSSNVITSLDSGPFSHLSQCLVLDLSANRLEEIQNENWEGLNSLKDLVLSNNKIHTVHSRAFFSLTSLQNLFLDGNGITALRADQWNGLESLLYLSLQQNGIQIIHAGVFNSLKSLTALDLENNRLTEITDGMWQGLGALQRLTLSKNQITSVSPGGFSRFVNLIWLDISWNELKAFNQSDFAAEVFSDERGDKLVITLYRNPLMCDTRMCWLKKAEENGWIEVTIHAFYNRGKNCMDEVNFMKPWDRAHIDCEGQ